MLFQDFRRSYLCLCSTLTFFIIVTKLKKLHSRLIRFLMTDNKKLAISVTRIYVLIAFTLSYKKYLNGKLYFSSLNRLFICQCRK